MTEFLDTVILGTILKKHLIFFHICKVRNICKIKGIKTVALLSLVLRVFSVFLNMRLFCCWSEENQFLKVLAFRKI
jgi:hypothetical protein